MKTLTFIRHAQSMANIDKVMSGQTDAQLSENGILELKALKETLNYPEADLLISSDLTRAIDTAKLIYEDAKPLPMEEFREINFGPFEGRPISEAVEDFYARFLADDKEGDMETFVDVKERVERGIRKVISQLNESEKNRATIVAHNGLLRMVHYIFKPTSPEKYRDFQTKNGHGFSLILDAYDNLVNVEYF